MPRLTDDEKTKIDSVICTALLEKGLARMSAHEFMRAVGWPNERFADLRSYFRNNQLAVAKRLSAKSGRPVLPRTTMTRASLSLALAEPGECPGCGRPMEVIERGGPHYGDCITPGSRVERPGSVQAHGRILEVKTKVEDLKARVRDLQADLPSYRQRADRGERGAADKYREMKRRLAMATDELKLAKTELVALSGNPSDPKWSLIVEAWRVLEAVAASGVDIGERGQKLLEDIEFHVPPEKLLADEEEGEGEEEGSKS